MKKKLILLKNVKYNYDTAVEPNEDGEVSAHYLESEYVVMSKVVEVDFPELSNDEVVKSQIAIIDKQITKVKADSEAAITALVGRKQELLALPSNS